MRVLQIGKFYPPYPGGMETHLKDLCEGIKNFVDLNVIVSNTSFKYAVENINGVPVFRLPRICEISSNSICPTMPFHVRRFKADLIHIHFPNPMAHLALLMAEGREKIVLTWHSDIIRQKKLLKIYTPFLERLLTKADHIIATSENYINHSPFLSRYKSKCSVVPLSIHADNFKRNRFVNIEIDSISKKYGNGPFILFAGRLASYKGIDFLIEAMKKIDAKLLIVGDGPQYFFLRNMVSKSGLVNRVFFCGAVEEKALPAYYHACDIFVLPSIVRSEAFGIVQLEAMACGKPVVSTKLESGVPFVNQHGKTGIIVPPKNASALSSAINKLLCDEKLRKEYGENGIKRVTDEFSTELMISRTLEIYNKIL